MKKTKPLVGVTGIFGSGKTTVSRMFGELGVPVFSADQAARQVSEDKDVVKTIAATFGTEVLQGRNGIDRNRLADLVFKDPEKLQRLNEIIHPLVRNKMWEFVRLHENDDRTPMIVVDVPLVYETDLYKHLDFVVVVFADEETCILRVMNRNGLSRDAIFARLSQQIPISEKKERADFCIDNDGNEESLVSRVEEVFNEIRKRWVSNNAKTNL